MANLVVVGAQWGDEGKGKLVDVLAEHADVVVRFQGGANAGHTLVIDGEKLVLHHIPAGIMQPNKLCYIASGVVVDPRTLVEEIELLKSKGALSDDEHLKISEFCNVVMPYHKAIDGLLEACLGDDQIGTTGRGIGPCYVDLVGRRGIRLFELLDRSLLEGRLDWVLAEKDHLIEFYGGDPMNREVMVQDALIYGERLRRYLDDVGKLTFQHARDGRTILFEGAQGTLLDVMHGTYPYVTSSSTVAGSACVGTGLGPSAISRVIGITKAYTTRVGEGPFPTEQKNEIGEWLQQKGDEFGSTTGRPRRCGWLDAAALRYAIRVNGFDCLAITKLDVLTGLEEIRVCVGYEYQGDILSEIPRNQVVLANCKPIYERFPGWQQDVRHVTYYEDLPENAQHLLEWIQVLVNCPISLISVGPARENLIVLQDPYLA